MVLCVNHMKGSKRRIKNLVIEPYAGRVPGTNEAARLDAPSATSSRLGLIEYPKRDAFCLAATMLSRNPTTQISLPNR